MGKAVGYKISFIDNSKRKVRKDAIKAVFRTFFMISKIENH